MVLNGSNGGYLEVTSETLMKIIGPILHWDSSTTSSVLSWMSSCWSLELGDVVVARMTLTQELGGTEVEEVDLTFDLIVTYTSVVSE